MTVDQIPTPSRVTHNKMRCFPSRQSLNPINLTEQAASFFSDQSLMDSLFGQFLDEVKGLSLSSREAAGQVNVTNVHKGCPE